MKILTVDFKSARGANHPSTARAIDRSITHDKDFFYLNAADCSTEDCKCGLHAARNQERRRLVSDADLRAMSFKDLLKLKAHGMASTDEERMLAMRAFKELWRRQWA
jgi:hypothetical protein